MLSQLDAHPASFSDDTSLPFTVLRVSINGQVIKENPIDWFYSLRSFCRDAQGEIKRKAVEIFFALTPLNRELLFRTLRKVRIHISDARPYVAGIADVFAHMLPAGVTASDFLKDGSNVAIRHLDRARDIARDWLAMKIVHDSSAQRLFLLYRAHEYWSMQRLHITKELADEMGVQPDPPMLLPVDLDGLRGGKSKIITGVVNGVSSSASVFTRAADVFEEESRRLPRFGISRTLLLNRTLHPCHVFDEGHSNIVKWVDQQRKVVLAHATTHPLFREPEHLIEVGSAGSPEVQCADIAAGIASSLWQRGNLVSITRRFEYVTYNGERISDDKAASCQRVIDKMWPS